jgi:hypothetical protein
VCQQAVLPAHEHMHYGLNKIKDPKKNEPLFY